MSESPVFPDSPQPGQRLLAVTLVALLILSVTGFHLYRTGQRQGRADAVPLPQPLPEVLVMGSSVDRDHEPDDPEPRTLPQLLAAELEPAYTVGGLNHGAYYGRIYAAYARHLQRLGVRDRIAVVQVNLRSLNGAWSDNPNWQFPDLEEGLRSWEPATPLLERVEASLQVGPLLWLREKFTVAPHRIATPIATGPVSVVLTDGRGLTFNQYFQLFTAQPATPEAKLRRQRDLFMAHAGYRLQQKNNPGLQGLLETGSILRGLGWRVLYYVTPMDVQEAARLDPRLRPAIENNARQVAATLQAAGFGVCNLVSALPSAQFIDREMVIEHITGQGKLQVARALAAAVRKMGEKRPSQDNGG